MSAADQTAGQNARRSLGNVINYDDPEQPQFKGRYASNSPALPDSILAVTYNIREGKAVAEAGDALMNSESLKEADIVLLQEMDESGVDEIARLLNANYVYYPAYQRRTDRNVGNAILTRWPISDERKVILPGRHPVTGQIRIAACATVEIGNVSVSVYSVHTETYSTMASHRKEQVAALVKDIGPGASPVIVGGDFNTVSKRSIQRMTEQFAEVGLARASAGVGPTIARFGLKPAAADHLFTRGFTTIAAGKVEGVRASDHLPVWTQLKWASGETY